MIDISDSRDVFLCHTSADKERFVHPFMEELDKWGIRFWVDQTEIEWGDLLTKKLMRDFEFPSMFSSFYLRILSVETGQKLNSQVR